MFKSTLGVRPEPRKALELKLRAISINFKSTLGVRPEHRMAPELELKAWLLVGSAAGSMRSHFAESGPPPRRFTVSYWYY